MFRRSKTKLIIPAHVAIIMDGNNRWTKKKKLKGFAGHEKGIDSIQTAVDTAIFYNIKFLTLFSFSSENWARPEKEVKFLMNLLRRYLSKKIKKLMESNISIKMIGDKKKLPKDIVNKIEKYQKLTSKNNQLHLNFALNYGSRNEILIALRKIISKYVKKKNSN